MLTGYEEACLFNARAAANKQLIVRNRENDLGTQTTQDLADGTDEFGNPVMTLEPGTVLDIGDKDAVPFSPEFPTAQHESFMKSTLHGISAGVGMAYSSVTNDLGDTSYSSGRIGLIEERDMWKLRQQVFIEQVLNPLFERWLPMAILSGQVALPMAKIEKFMQPVWIGRRWSWVDPLKDLAAMALAREIKVETLTQQLAEKGDDLIETLTEFKEEEKAAQQLGLTTVVKSKEAAPPAQEGDPAGTPAEKSPNAEKGKRYLDLALALLAEDAGTNGKGH
jgi:lambda family phage portal protein